jgi:hypothetical protein
MLGFAFTPDILSQPVAQGCGLPGDDCTRQLARDAVGDLIWEGIELADPFGGVAVFAYAARGSKSG